MPLYKVSLKQGNRSITAQYYAKSLENLKQFLNAVTTAKVQQIYEVHYNDELSKPPIDDFNYYKQYKAFVMNNNRLSNQVLIHNVKKTLNEDTISNLIKTHLEVAGLKVTGVTCSLFMQE